MSQLKRTDQDRPAPEPARVAAEPRPVDIGAVSHRGTVRDANEDAFVVCRAGRYLERVASNLPEDLVTPLLDESAHLILIADGMGGHAAGEVASHSAIAGVIQLFFKAPKWALKLEDPRVRTEEVKDMWVRARGYLDGVHDMLKRQAERDPRLEGMGTTLTGAYLVGPDLFLMHVGDSRAYLHRGGALHKITRDHTLAQSYADLGILSADDPSSGGLHHVLTQAVGASHEPLKPDMHAVRLKAGDRLLLCTDGLSNIVAEDEIAEILSRDLPGQQLCQILIDEALECGAPDNVTAIVVRYGG